HTKDNFPWRSVHVMMVDCEIFHGDHDASRYLLLQRMIHKNVSCYYKICTSTTHDTKDCRLIDQIHDAIDTGVCTRLVLQAFPRMRAIIMKGTQMEGVMEEAFAEDLEAMETMEVEEVSSHVELVTTMGLRNTI
ncbi:hypothetical protein KI387_036665, partial [Taxus chinensis]